MTADDRQPTEAGMQPATAVAGARVGASFAYALDALDYPDTTGPAPVPAAGGRAGWWWALAALCAAAAALLIATVIGVQIMRGANVPIVTVATPTVTVTQSTQTVTLTAPDQDTAYLMELVRVGKSAVPAAYLVSDAHYVCNATVAGMTPMQIEDAFVVAGKGINEESVLSLWRVLIPIAIAHYCPTQ